MRSDWLRARSNGRGALMLIAAALVHSDEETVEAVFVEIERRKELLGAAGAIASVYDDISRGRWQVC